MCSSNLQQMHVSDMGRQLCGEFLLPLLKIGMTLAIFQSVGNKPDDNDC